MRSKNNRIVNLIYCRKSLIDILEVYFETLCISAMIAAPSADNLSAVCP